MATLSELVQRTITRLSMVAGISVQVYAEDRIAEMIEHKFIMTRDELWWDDFMQYVSLTCGADGRPLEQVFRSNAAAIAAGGGIVINKYSDIQHVWRTDVRDPLKPWPRRANPVSIMRTGRLQHYYPDPTRVIRFGPFDAGQQVVLRSKIWYDKFQPDDTVPLDEQLLILGACWDYLEDDGTNPGQAEKFKVLFEQRLTSLKGQENDEPIMLSPTQYSGASGYQVIGPVP